MKTQVLSLQVCFYIFGLEKIQLLCNDNIFLSIAIKMTIRYLTIAFAGRSLKTPDQNKSFQNSPGSWRFSMPPPPADAARPPHAAAFLVRRVAGTAGATTCP